MRLKVDYCIVSDWIKQSDINDIFSIWCKSHTNISKNRQCYLVLKSFGLNVRFMNFKKYFDKLSGSWSFACPSVQSQKSYISRILSTDWIN